MGFLKHCWQDQFNLGFYVYFLCIFLRHFLSSTAMAAQPLRWTRPDQQIAPGPATLSCYNAPIPANDADPIDFITDQR